MPPFSSFNDETRISFTRLNQDGSLDYTFNPDAYANGFVTSIDFTKDRRVIFGGQFKVVNGEYRSGIAILDSIGELDINFDLRNDYKEYLNEGDINVIRRLGDYIYFGSVASSEDNKPEEDKSEKSDDSEDDSSSPSEENKAVLSLELKYHSGNPVISNFERVSKPGRRIFSSANGLPKINNGLGIAIISTPKGVMTDMDARKQKVGGEIICKVF